PQLAYSLQEFPYEEKPIYNALSYVWGPDDVATNDSIIIDGSPQVIRKNLSNALAVLAKAEFRAENIECSEPFYLWVDAICINQSDDEEKARVVPHMGLIYADASRVYAWLG
ncbi:hypothetical protein DM02DRAFT_504681, partial [Periconia macrospinosa]